MYNQDEIDLEDGWRSELAIVALLFAMGDNCDKLKVTYVFGDRLKII
jgi:hypothetical protein